MRNPFAAKTDPQSETERGYREQMAQLCLDGATVPRARYILELDTAIMKDTPFSRGVLAATADYIHANEPEKEAESG